MEDMKIKFTLFNNGQEHYEFDTDSLEEGLELDKFLINKDDYGRMYIVPMVCENKCCWYALPVLEKTNIKLYENVKIY